MANAKRHRLLQFKIRTALIGVAVIAVLLTALVVPALRQRGVVKAIVTDGGTVQYSDEHRRLRERNTISKNDVSAVRRFLEQLFGIDFIDHPHAVLLSHDQCSDETCGLISRLPTVKIVVMNAQHLTDAGLLAIKNLDLTELFLESPGFTDEGLSVVRNFHKLMGLSITDGTQITGSGLRHLDGLVRLKYLQLDNLPVRDEELKHLAMLTQLEKLALDGVPISDEGLLHLANLTALWRLNLRGSKVKGPGLRHLQAMDDLVELDLGESAVEGGLDNLAALDSLYQVFLEGTKVTDPALEPLGSLKKLSAVWLKNTAITSQGMLALAKSTSLEVLRLNFTAVDDAGLHYLTGMPSLRTLDLQGTRVTDVGAAEFRRVMPDCTVTR